MADCNGIVSASCPASPLPLVGTAETGVFSCAVIFQFPPSPKPFFYEGRVLLIISTLLSTLFLFLAIDVASFQQVEGPNDRWAGEFYAALVYKFLLSLSSLYALARLVPTFYTTVDAGPHSRWSMLGLGVEACALLLQGTAMGMRKFEAPFRLDLEVDMSRVERIMYTTQMVLPLGMLAGRKIVMLVKVSRMKWGQRTAVIGSNIEAGEEADESTSLLHDA
jgi:hypothetical protein